jgi:hypothetical protein
VFSQQLANMGTNQCGLVLGPIPKLVLGPLEQNFKILDKENWEWDLALAFLLK